jgi:hypothetical protein
MEFDKCNSDTWSNVENTVLSEKRPYVIWLLYKMILFIQNV